MTLRSIIYVSIILILSNICSIAQAQKMYRLDSIKKTKELLKDATVKSIQKEIKLTIRNVDITEFPRIKIIVEAYNTVGDPLDTLYADDLKVLENGVEKAVISVEKITVKERVPVDFIFVIDITASMQKYIDDVKKHISGFTTSIVRRGIDYRLGLVLFSDYVERIYDLTDNVPSFLYWLEQIKSQGGGDEKENALEAIHEAINIKHRPSANRVAILITDAPYHQSGEEGNGVTYYTTQSIIDYMNNNDMRLFCMTPNKLHKYKRMSNETRGTFYDIDYPFSTVLDNFSNQLTNLYAIKYSSAEPTIPDSIEIALLNEKKKELVRKTIPIVELGRKLIIENLLYKVNSSVLPQEVKELEVLTEFMKNKTNVEILVEGHTDSRGSYALNDALSKKRALSVKDYLVSKGIASRRIGIIGYGERKPIASNTTDFGRRLNRRTEIVIVAK